MTVKLTLNNATSTTTNVSIQISGQSNCAFELLPSHPLKVNGSFTFTGLAISTHSVTFTVSSGAAFTGTIDLPILGPKKDAKIGIQVNNVTADSVYVEWPLADEQVQQELTPGTPMMLGDLVPDSNPPDAAAKT